MNMLHHALEYAANGWAVFPIFGIEDGKCSCGRVDCPNPGKHPKINGGFKAASTDERTIQEWWQSDPNANIGIATGSPSGLFVVDVDTGPDKQGFENLALLEERHGALPRDKCVRTGSGGLHIYLSAPQQEVRNSAGKLAPNIDVRGEGGYVVAPPSRHISGNSYVWEQSNAV